MSTVGRKGPRCPECGGRSSNVLRAYALVDGSTTRARRCKACQHQWRCVELNQEDLMALKALVELDAKQIARALRYIL